MPAAERGVVKPPNEGEFKSDRRANGFLPLAGEASTVKPSNEARPGGDRRMGSFPLAGGASPINPPNQTGGDRRGYSSDEEMPAAVEPGKGAVPVNPGIGGRIGSMPVVDMAPPKSGR